MRRTINTRQAFSELDEFLELLSEEKRNEIPKRLRNFFKEEKDQKYFKGINKDVPIKDQNLKEETLALIAILNIQYWCKDEDEKKRLKEIYEKNENKYQTELRERYNLGNIFETKSIAREEKIEDTSMIEYKEPFIKRMFGKMLVFLRKK